MHAAPAAIGAACRAPRESSAVATLSVSAASFAIASTPVSLSAASFAFSLAPTSTPVTTAAVSLSATATAIVPDRVARRRRSVGRCVAVERRQLR